MQLDFGLLVLAYCPYDLTSTFLVALLELRCVFNHVNCPAVICSPGIAVLSSFGRETSLVNIMGPRSIFPTLLHLHFTFCFYSPVAMTINFHPCFDTL